MKTLTNITRLVLASAILFFTVSLLAQTASAPTDAGQVLAPGVDTAQLFLQPFIQTLTGKYGWLTQVFVVIGFIRVLAKPLMAAAENYAATTSSPNDDVALSKFESGPIWKGIAFFLDLCFSLKLHILAPATVPPPVIAAKPATITTPTAPAA